MRFKKGSKRDANLDFERSNLLSKLYSPQFASKISKVKLICNVDDTTLWRGTINQYSWLKRGMSWSLNNVVLKDLKAWSHASFQTERWCQCWSTDRATPKTLFTLLNKSRSALRLSLTFGQDRLLWYYI